MDGNILSVNTTYHLVIGLFDQVILVFYHHFIFNRIFNDNFTQSHISIIYFINILLAVILI